MFRILLIALLMSSINITQAIERGTPEQARALAERAAEHLDKAGDRAEALASFSAPNGRFSMKDLYVFVIDTEGNVMAHGANEKLVGKNILNARDVDGTQFTVNTINTALDNRAGWAPRFRFPDPITKKIGTKQSYLVLVDNLIVGVGYFIDS